MLRCTIYQSMAAIAASKEFQMSKRLMTSAIVATLLMAATTIYSTMQQDQPQTASTTVLMGG